MSAISCSISLSGYPVYSVSQLLDELDNVENSDIGQLVVGVDRSRFLNKVNSFTSAGGFDPGRGYVLMRGSDVTKLITPRLNNTDFALTFGFNSKEVIIQKLLVVSCEGITTGKGSDDDALFLVELADLRILGPLTTINKGYNCYSQDNSQYVATLSGGSALYTYEDVVNNIWTLMPSVFGSLNLDNAALDGNPSNYGFYGISAWDALKKVCDDTNHILTLNKAGEFSILSCFDSSNETFQDNLDDANKYLLLDTKDKVSYAHKVPASITVYFPSRNFAWQTITDPLVNHPNDLFRTVPLCPVVVPTNVTGAVAGTNMAVHDSLPALYNDQGTLQNNTALTNRAATLVSNYVDSIKTADNTFLYRHTGAHEFQHDVSVDCVCWYDFGSGFFTDVRGTYRPRISSPLIDMKRGSSFDSVNDSVPGNLPLSPKELNGPPLVRNAELPDRFALVQITGGPDANGKMTATIQAGTGSTSLGSPTTTTWAGTSHTLNIWRPNNELVWLDKQTGRWLQIAGAEIHRGITTAPMTKGGAAVGVTRYVDGTDTPSSLTDQVVSKYIDVGTGKSIMYVRLGTTFYLFAVECPPS